MPFLSKINTISGVEFDSNIKHGISYLGPDITTGVFSTFTHSWIACDSKLYIIKHSDGSVQCSWTFGEDPTDTFEITCAIEFQIEGCSIPLLIVGVSSQNTNKICFFNPNTRKVIRTIECNFPVRVLCIVEDGLNEINPIKDALSNTEGLLAVGCADGSIYIVDLCRSLLLEALKGNFEFVSDENRPAEICVIDVESVTPPLVQEKLKECYETHASLAVHLSDDYDDGITALCYSFESAILYAGTSSGSVVLWNLTNLDCLFRSQSTSHAVTSLSLLEPCDDPKYNLFLWVCYENYSQAVMYCIAFSTKFFAPGYGAYYQGFESVGIVYRLVLDQEILVLRTINSLAVAKSLSKNLSKSFRISGSEATQLRLFVTGLEVVTNGVQGSKMVVFDLNQWYKEQLPEEGLSSCIEVLDLGFGGVCYFALDPSSLLHYQWVRPLEQHYHPSALDFRFWCIEEEGIRCLEKLGLQSQWLKNMSIVGPSALLSPQQIFQGAISAGLLPTFIDPPDLEYATVDEERKYILTVCLENRATSVVEHCAREWSTASHPVAGCTLGFLVDWLWELHGIYKSHGNRMCVPLFDQSGLIFDVSERKTLQHCKSLLSTVQVLYTNIIRTYRNFILTNGLEQKLAAMSLVSFYFECCLKFISANLLPEPNDEGRPIDSISYKFNEINNYVCLRRKEGPFLGDTLIGRSGGEKEWEEEGGTGRYPPPSIQSVLRYCLHPSPLPSNKLSLILYLYIDIINSLAPISNEGSLNKVDNFQFLLRVSDTQYKIVTGFWYLDHNLFDDGIALLLDPRILRKDISQDQHRSVLKLLLQHGKEKLALRFLRLKSSDLHHLEDFRLEIDLLLGIRLINEAFMFQRKHPEYREELLEQFFQGCLEKKLLGNVFGLHLDSKEESVLFKFLKSSNVNNKGDLMIQFLLSRGKYSEAMSLNDTLNSTKIGPKGQLNTRDRIVRGITGGLDTTSRDIAYEMKHYKPPPPGTRPKPLSTLIKIRNEADGPILQIDSGVLIRSAARSVRHLSDYIKENEQKNKKRSFDEEEPMDVSLDDPPMKRPRLHNSDLSRFVPWPTTPSKSSNNQEREVMELVGTPLVRKSGKRLSPHSKPSSILKAKTPQIADDSSSTPIRKTLRFALPDNEKQVLSGRSLFSSKIEEVEHSKREDRSKFPSEHVTGRKSFRSSKTSGKDSPMCQKENNDSLLIMESIRDRLRSSKTKLLNDGAVDWQNVAESSQPKTLFTTGSSRKQAFKPGQVPSGTRTPIPRAEETFLGIPVSSSEKKYLESPSRDEELSPNTEAIFNTTLAKRLFTNDTLSEDADSDLNEESSLERYKRLRRGQILSSSNSSCVTMKKEDANNEVLSSKVLDGKNKNSSESEKTESITEVSTKKSLPKKNTNPEVKKIVSIENKTIPGNKKTDNAKDISRRNLEEKITNEGVENEDSNNEVLPEKSIGIYKTSPEKSMTPNKKQIIGLESEDSEDEAIPFDKEEMPFNEEEFPSDEEAVVSDVKEVPLVSKSDDEEVETDEEAIESDDEPVESNEEGVESDGENKMSEEPFFGALSVSMVGTIDEEEFENMESPHLFNNYEDSLPKKEESPSEAKIKVIEVSSDEENDLDHEELHENSSNSTNFSFGSQDVYGDLETGLDYEVLGIPRNQNQNELNLDTEDSLVEKISTVSDEDIVPEIEEKKSNITSECDDDDDIVEEISSEESQSEDISYEEGLDSDNKEYNLESLSNDGVENVSVINSDDSNEIAKTEVGDEEKNNVKFDNKKDIVKPKSEKVTEKVEEQREDEQEDDPFEVKEPYPNLEDVPIVVGSDSSGSSERNENDPQGLFDSDDGGIDQVTNFLTSHDMLPGSFLSDIVPIKVAPKYESKPEKSSTPTVAQQLVQDESPSTSECRQAESIVFPTPTQEDSIKVGSSDGQVSIKPTCSESKLETLVESTIESSEHENLVVHLEEAPKVLEEKIDIVPPGKQLGGSRKSEIQFEGEGFKASGKDKELNIFIKTSVNEKELKKPTLPDTRIKKFSETTKLMSTDLSTINSEQLTENLPTSTELKTIKMVESSTQILPEKVSESKENDSNTALNISTKASEKEKELKANKKEKELNIFTKASENEIEMYKSIKKEKELNKANEKEKESNKTNKNEKELNKASEKEKDLNKTSKEEQELNKVTKASEKEKEMYKSNKTIEKEKEFDKASEKEKEFNKSTKASEKEKELNKACEKEKEFNKSTKVSEKEKEFNKSTKASEKEKEFNKSTKASEKEKELNKACEKEKEFNKSTKVSEKEKEFNKSTKASEKEKEFNKSTKASEKEKELNKACEKEKEFNKSTKVSEKEKEFNKSTKASEKEKELNKACEKEKELNKACEKEKELNKVSEKEKELTTLPDKQAKKFSETIKLMPTDVSTINPEQLTESLQTSTELETIKMVESTTQNLPGKVSDSKRNDPNEESEITTTVIENNKININTDIKSISANKSVPVKDAINKTLSIQIEDVSSNTESNEPLKESPVLQIKSSEKLDTVSNDPKLSHCLTIEAGNSSTQVFSLKSHAVDLENPVVFSAINKTSNRTTTVQYQEKNTDTIQFNEESKSNKFSHVSDNTEEIKDSKNEISTTVPTTDCAKSEQVLSSSECKPEVQTPDKIKSSKEPLSEPDSVTSTRQRDTSIISSITHIIDNQNKLETAGHQETTLHKTESLTKNNSNCDTISPVVNISLKTDSASFKISGSISSKNIQATNLIENTEVVKNRNSITDLITHSEGTSESPKVEMKSFFFGRDEKSETYLQTTAKATFQVGSRISLPSEDEPVDPMEIAMIEEEESLAEENEDTDPRNTCILDPELSLHLSDDELISDTKPKMIDKGIVTTNSYLAHKARKSRNIDNTKGYKPTQVMVVTDVLKDNKKILPIASGKNKEKPTMQSIGIQSDSFTAESSEALNVKLQLDSDKKGRRQRRSSTSSQVSNKDTDLKGILKNKSELISEKSLDTPADAKIIETKSEGTEEPHETRSIRRNRRSSVCSQSSDVVKDLKFRLDDFSEETKVSRRSSREPGLHGILKKSKKIESSDANENQEVTSSKRSHSASIDDSVPKEKQSRKSISASDKDILNAHERNRRSLEPELCGILKNKTKRRSSSYTSETAIDLNKRLKEDFSEVKRRSRRYSEEPDLKGILKRTEGFSKVDYGSKNRASTSRHSEGLPNHGILKNKYDTSSELKSCMKEDFPLEQRRRRSSVDSESSVTRTVLERKSKRHSLAADSESVSKTVLEKKSGRHSLGADLECEGYYDKYRLRSYSEEPEIRGILKNSERRKRRSYTSETSSDFKLRLEEDFPDEKKSRRKSKRFSSTSDVSSQNSDYHQTDHKNRLEHDLSKEKWKSINAADDERYMTSSRMKSERRSESDSHLSIDNDSLEERKVRTRRKSSSEEPTECRRSLRQNTPERKNRSTSNENKVKVTPKKLFSGNKKLDYSEEDNAVLNKSKPQQDNPIRRSSRLRSVLEVIEEVDEVTPMKKKRKSPEMSESQKLPKDAKPVKNIETWTIPDITIVNSDDDSNDSITGMKALTEGYAKERRLTRTQKKVLLRNVNLLEGISPSTSSDFSTPKKGGKTSASRKMSTTPSPTKTPSLSETPTRTSLRLQKKPPSENGD